MCGRGEGRVRYKGRGGGGSGVKNVQCEAPEEMLTFRGVQASPPPCQAGGQEEVYPLLDRGDSPGPGGGDTCLQLVLRHPREEAAGGQLLLDLPLQEVLPPRVVLVEVRVLEGRGGDGQPDRDRRAILDPGKAQADPPTAPMRFDD